MNVQPSFDLFPCLAPPALDHVPKERPRARTKPNQGDPPLQQSSRHRNRSKDIFQLLKDVRLAVQDPLLGVLGVEKRFREMRAHPAEELHLHSHRLRDDKDVGEDDGGVEETVVPPDGLHREFGSEFGRTTNGEERVLLPDDLELGEVATGLTHYPDGRVGEGERGFVGGGLEEQVILERGEVGEDWEIVVFHCRGKIDLFFWL